MRRRICPITVYRFVFCIFGEVTRSKRKPVYPPTPHADHRRYIPSMISLYSDHRIKEREGREARTYVCPLELYKICILFNSKRPFSAFPRDPVNVSGVLRERPLRRYHSRGFSPGFSDSRRRPGPGLRFFRSAPAPAAWQYAQN